MDGHHLHVALGERPIRVLVLVDSAGMKKAQEAVEEVQTEDFTIPVRDDGVVIVPLEDVQQLGENGKVAGDILVSDRASKRLQRKELVEVIGRTTVQRLARF